MEINLSSVLIGPLIGAIIGFAVWYFQSRIDKINKESDKLNDKRREIYSRLLEPFIRMFAGIKNPDEAKNALDQILSFDYKKTAFEFTLMGSDEVVRSFNELMQYIYKMELKEDTQKAMKEFLIHWGNFLLVIRRNLGNPKTKLNEIDMLRNQITDIDAMLKIK